jgi:hypothetical protein
MRIQSKYYNAISLFWPVAGGCFAQEDTVRVVPGQRAFPVRFPRRSVLRLAIPQAIRRTLQRLLRHGFFKPPRRHQHANCLANLAHTQVRIFFPSTPDAPWPGTDNSHSTPPDAGSGPPTSGPRNDPDPLRPCRPRNTVPPSTAKRPPAPASKPSSSPVRCLHTISPRPPTDCEPPPDATARSAGRHRPSRESSPASLPQPSVPSRRPSRDTSPTADPAVSG